MTHLKNTQHSCSLCSLSEICLPLGVDKQNLALLENLVKNSEVQHTGDVVLHQGDPFTTIFAVKSGMYKSVKIDNDGTQKVTGFHLPGELVGLDAIYPQHYTCNVIALNTSALCQINYDQLTALSIELPSLQRQLLRLLSKEVNSSNEMLKEQTAEQKLASFIHNLAIRYHLRGYSDTHLILPMTRQDIANHLGLTPETISRLLKRFQEKNVLAINNREITIVNPEMLVEFSGCESESVLS